jgi:porin
VHDDAFAPTRLWSGEGEQYEIEIEKDFKGGYVKLGHWGNTIKTDYIDGSGATGDMSGDYAQLSLTLIEESDPDQGLKGWLRAGTANADGLALDQYIGGGLVYSGPFKGRDHDQAGFAVAHARFGKPYRAAQSNRVTAETSYELTYQAEVRPGFVLQPELQYIKHPSGAHDIKDALIVGLQFRVGLEALN